MKKSWTLEEIEFLNENFPNKFTSEIAEFLNRTEYSVNLKANKLGLKKSKSHKSLCISKRNKMVGHQWTKKELITIGKQYTCRSEFQKDNSAAYSAAKKMGVLDEICSHMINKSFSIPQIILKSIINKLFDTTLVYNDRTTLKPYELDVYLPKYKLAFEYNGKGWHKENKNDLLKNNLAISKGIKIITIFENNRNYIVDIKNQLINHLAELNNYINVNGIDILKIEIENPYKDVYNLDSLMRLCQSYHSFKDFYSENYGVYIKISKLGLIDSCTSHMCCRRKKRNIIEVKEIISRYDTLLDFIKNESSTYQFVKKNNLDYLILHLKKSR